MANKLRDDLVTLLQEAALSVKQDDSFEGSIRWTCLEDDIEPGTFEVQAFVRVGNSEGQGGSMIVEATKDGPFAREEVEKVEKVEQLRLIASIAQGFAVYEYKEWFDAVQSISNGAAEIKVNGDMIEAWL